MYVHVGAGRTLRRNEIIGIFDLDGAVTTEDTANFLKKAQKEAKITSAGEDLPKCFVLVGKKDPRGKINGDIEVIFSHISAGTIYKNRSGKESI